VNSSSRIHCSLTGAPATARPPEPRPAPHRRPRCGHASGSGHMNDIDLRIRHCQHLGQISRRGNAPWVWDHTVMRPSFSHATAQEGPIDPCDKYERRLLGGNSFAWAGAGSDWACGADDGSSLREAAAARRVNRPYREVEPNRRSSAPDDVSTLRAAIALLALGGDRQKIASRTTATSRKAIVPRLRRRKTSSLRSARTDNPCQRPSPGSLISARRTAHRSAFRRSIRLADLPTME